MCVHAHLCVRVCMGVCAHEDIDFLEFVIGLSGA